MKAIRLAAVLVVALCALTFGQGLTLNPAFGAILYSNFIDDTVTVQYRDTLTLDTVYSDIIGMSVNHQEGPDLGLWNTLFWKVTPDSADSLAVTDVTVILQEVDYWRGLGDTVFTQCPDTAADTIAVTGSAASDSTWNKIAFSPNPCNGYRLLVIAEDACSDVMNSTFKFWIHIRKKLITSN